MFPQSIRWRIQAWHGFLLVCLVTALIVGFYSYERRARFRDLDSQLHQLITPILPRLAPPHGRSEGGARRGPPPGEEGKHRTPNIQRPTSNDQRGEAPPVRDNPFGLIETGQFYYAAWTSDEDRPNLSASAPMDVARPRREEFAAHNPLRTRGEFRELVHFVPSGDIVLVGASTAKIHAELRRLAFGLTLAGLAVIGIGLAGGWWLSGRVLRPISEINATAEKIAAGELSKRIVVQEKESELGQLASVLNNTFDRLEKSFEQQVRFTADASHELRTPISVLLTQIQLALSRERSPEEYRETLKTCERAAERMRNLVNQLLELARVDAGEITVLCEQCDLADVAREALAFIEPLAKNKKSSLQSSLESVRIKADAMKLSQVFVNLLNNALHHNEPGVEVRLSVQKNSARAIIRISDNGMGIPKEALPQLFGRFYRVDKARSRKKGSSGLGLAICKTIVEAHRGQIKVESKVGFGTAFTVELPLNPQTQNVARTTCPPLS